MSKLSAATEVDQDKIDNGIEVTFIAGDSQFRTRITRGGAFNKRIAKRAAELTKSFRASNTDLAEVSADIQRSIRAKLLSEIIILGWNEDDFGEPWSQEAAERECLASTDYAEFIDKECQQAQQFRKSAVVEHAGNSAGRSDTV